MVALAPSPSSSSAKSALQKEITTVMLGRVDEFDQAEGGGEGDDRPEVSFGLFASQGDALEALDTKGLGS
jgi:hypothetical protein